MQEINEKEFKNIIAEKLKYYRKETQEKVAEDASISTDTLSSTERGLTIINSLNLVKLCNSLDVTPNDVLEDFISNRSKLLDYKLTSAFQDLSIKEKSLLLDIAEFFKSNKN